MADNRVHELLTGLTVVLRTNGIKAGSRQTSEQDSENGDKLATASPPQVIIYTRSVDDDYCHTFMSDNVMSQLGYKAEDLVRDPAFWTDRVHPEDIQTVMSAFQSVFQDGHYLHEYRFRHADGSFRWMRDEFNLMRDTIGAPYEIIGSWTDVTESRRRETVLR